MILENKWIRGAIPALLIHCSYCKYFYCYNASMYCFHPTKCHKITAARKYGCKYFDPE